MNHWTKVASALALTAAVQLSAAGGPVNNVVDCAQYPDAEAQKYAAEYLPDCRAWAQSQGYRDAVVLPMEIAARGIELASDPLTCPSVKPGNRGVYCIGLDKAAN